jgi:hypothetical protein
VREGKRGKRGIGSEREEEIKVSKEERNKER